MRTFIFLILSALFFSCKEKTLFTRLDTEVTGVLFANRITESEGFNILNFEYIYNGSGVGIADFNNDGLQDIFFSGNQVDNKLYLNNGNFKFDDISEMSGIEGKGKWCSGVVIVDINSDGLMDVYLAATVKDSPAERENLLYVNQGIENGVPFFKEMAKEYGVNDEGHSENAAFFDYDNDGDLDLYVLTNIIDQYPNTYRPKVVNGSYPNTDRLYENNWDTELGHPVFTNVSTKAGVTIEGYGLGLNICDINKDGWKDIFITNDYAADDILYINNKNGTFTDQAKKYFKHTSNSAMGNDVADINNDGLLDLVSVDMLPKNNLRKKVLAPANNYQIYNQSDKFNYTYQYMRNTLQLNNGNSQNGETQLFSEIGILAGVAETDWSWSPSLADFDNDGYKDLLITNGFPKDVTDKDFMAFRSEAHRLADINFMLSQIPEVKISNYAFKNMGNLSFEDVTEKWGMDVPSFSNGAAYADLDNDGDLDYVINNINDSAFVYKNNNIENNSKHESHFLRIKFEGDKQNINGIGTVAILEFESGEKIRHENNPYRGYLSSIEPFMHFGLGLKKIKNLEVEWYNGSKQIIENIIPDQTLIVKIENADIKFDKDNIIQKPLFSDITIPSGINYMHKETDFVDFTLQNLLPSKLSELGPGMSVGDINKDGLDDVFMGGSIGFNGTFFIQTREGKFKEKFLSGSHINLMKKHEDLGSLLFDADHDGDLDLYICSGGNELKKEDQSYQDRFYINDGLGNFKIEEDALPNLLISTSCTRAADYDHDGDLDLFIAGRNVPGEYPKFTDSYLLRNDTKGQNVKFTNTSTVQFENLGLVNDMLWTDVDNDGWLDIFVVGEWASPRIFKNRNGTFSELENTGLESYLGLWTSINGGDLDNDGDIDYVLGNTGLNQLLKGSKEKPMRLIAKDFDNNGNYDLVPFVYFDDQEKKPVLVPFSSRDDLNKQLNSTRFKYTNYKDYAYATFENLFSIKEKENAQILDCNFLETVVIINLGNGKFQIKKMPIEAQISSSNSILIEDFDSDGNQDILISGNNYGNELSTGRLDASNGIFLKGNGEGQFLVIKNSGFYLPFNAKSSVLVSNPKGEIYIFGSQNRGDLKVYKTPLLKKNIVIKNEYTYFTFRINGKVTKKELYFGSSYLGQSSRFVVIPSSATNFFIE